MDYKGARNAGLLHCRVDHEHADFVGRLISWRDVSLMNSADSFHGGRGCLAGQIPSAAALINKAERTVAMLAFVAGRSVPDGGGSLFGARMAPPRSSRAVISIHMTVILFIFPMIWRICFNMH